MSPTFDGKKMVRETINRGKNGARVLITLEVTVSDEGLATLPAYKRTSQDYVRDTYNQQPLHDSLIDTLGEHCEVTEIKMEALS